MEQAFGFDDFLCFHLSWVYKKRNRHNKGTGTVEVEVQVEVEEGGMTITLLTAGLGEVFSLSAMSPSRNMSLKSSVSMVGNCEEESEEYC